VGAGTAAVGGRGGRGKEPRESKAQGGTSYIRKLILLETVCKEKKWGGVPGKNKGLPGARRNHGVNQVGTTKAGQGTSGVGVSTYASNHRGDPGGGKKKPYREKELTRTPGHGGRTLKRNLKIAGGNARKGGRGVHRGGIKRKTMGVGNKKRPAFVDAKRVYPG